MKIGTSASSFCSLYGDRLAIKKLAEAGFDSIDFGYFNYPVYSKECIFSQGNKEFEAYFRALGETAAEAGIEIGQVHSPMPSYKGQSDEEDEFLYKLQERSIAAASYMNSPYIIIHPCIPERYRYTEYRKETKKLNMKFYRRLLPALTKYNVKLSIENMFSYDPQRKCICPTVCSTADEMLDYIYTLNDGHFVACLDSGHALLTGGTPESMARTLGDKLETMHLHDNNGFSDEHKAPFLGITDWDGFYKTLEDIGYKGVFSFECDGFFTMYGKKLPEESAAFLCKLGRAITHTGETHTETKY